MRRRLALSTVAALLLAGTAACGGSDGSDGSDEAIQGLKVTGDFGKKPTVTVDGLDVSTTQSSEVITGDGPEITEDSLVNYRFFIASGKNGDEIANNFSQAEPQELDVAKQPELLSEAVIGTHIGSRVAIAAPVKDLIGDQGAPQVGLTAADDIVLVFDLIEEGTPPLTGPEGEKVDPPADAPKVLGGDKVTGLDFSDAPAEPPIKKSDFQAIPLINGAGPAVKEGDSISVNYFATVWGKGDKPFDNSYTSAPSSFTLTYPGLIEGWVKGLVGVKVGSRVMLIVPPALGYGAQGQPEIGVTSKDALVFVIDILDIN
jgi:peptidylprolyl isomerase